MEIAIITVMICLNLVQMTNSKNYRLLVEDQILPYNDRSITPLSDYLAIDNMILEQIDDDNVKIGGYLEAIKSMDPNLPIIVNGHTQVYEKASWNRAPYQLTLPNACRQFLNPQQPWYNITKLWNSDVCPPQLGDKWMIESQHLNIVFDVPSSFPIVPWRVYMLVSQGLPGFEKFKFGYGIQLNLLEIQ